MKVSVAVAIYNVDKYLGTCLASLEKQTMQDCEFICVDDGSTDDSAEIIKEYTKKDSRFRYVYKENGGLASARNRGLDEATGDYIVFLDGDDEYREKKHLEILYETAVKNNVDFVTFDSVAEYENEYVSREKNVGDYLTRSREYGFVKNGRELFCRMYENNDFCVMTWLLFIDRNWMIEKEIRFVEGILPEDNLFSFMCYMKAENGVYHINRAFHTYKIRLDGDSVKQPTFRHVYGFLYTLKSEFAYSVDYKFSHREQEALIKHLEPVREMIKEKFARLDYTERAKIYGLSGIDYFLFKSINPSCFMPAFDIDIHARGFFGILDNAKDFAIYGVGMVGKNLYRYLAMRRIADKIISFLVSQKNELQQFEGIPIKSLDEANIGRDSLVVVAVTDQYRRVITATLIDRGYTNILITDDTMIHYMSYCTG